eukprot:482788-Amphidinium_carterae.1
MMTTNRWAHCPMMLILHVCASQDGRHRAQSRLGTSTWFGGLPPGHFTVELQRWIQDINSCGWSVSGARGGAAYFSASRALTESDWEALSLHT